MVMGQILSETLEYFIAISLSVVIDWMTENQDHRMLV